MKKRLCWILIAAVLCVAFALQLYQPESMGIAYRITGGRNEMVLLGSIHVGSRAMYPMRKEIQKAIKEADVLVFECDTQSKEAAQITAELMKCSDDESLSSLIHPETRSLLTQTAQKLRLDDRTLETLKPWAVTSMLSVQTASAQMGKGSTALGVEEMVRKLGEQKVYQYLETAEEQLLLMDAFSSELQDYLLRTGCEAILHPQENSDLSNWSRWWAEGNAQAFAASYLTGLENEEEPDLAREYHDSLLRKRNERMAHRLSEMLEDENEKRFFVSIGLMHLVLPGDSVLSELEEMGYQVEAF